MGKDLDDLISDFELLDDWEDRYRHVIELGRKLPVMALPLKTPDTKVSGCASQVWIATTPYDGARGRQLRLVGDSDALVVKGLIAIVFMMMQDLTVAEIVALDAEAVFAKLGLREHLSQQRSNGLASMVKRIKADAAAAQAGGGIAGR